MDARGSAAGAGVGIGLRGPHLDEIVASRPAVALLEIHAENYLHAGPALRALERLRCDYPISIHAVGLSLGSADGVDRHHLGRLRALVDRLDPLLVSDHLAWSVAGGRHLNHLLPLPLTEETLAVLIDNVDAAQEALGRPLLVENPSSYLRFRRSTLSEPDLLAALARATGARLLCDVNNVFVSAQNLGFDAAAYLDGLPAHAVAQLHLAGHTANAAYGHTVLIDDHGSRVAPAVWALYRRAAARFTAPTVIEWDTDLPPLAVLLDEADTAAAMTAPRATHAGAA